MLPYTPTNFSQGRMDFAWEELSEEELSQAWADWEAGRGLIGGDPHRRPGHELLPPWGLNKPFFRTLALGDARGANGARFAAAIASDAPIEVEIGFGRGDFLLGRAQRHPDRLFAGYETHSKTTRLALERTVNLGLSNLWLSDDDARFSLPRLLPEGRLAAVHILFPDPWWKSTYRVRRLFTPPFVAMLARLIAPGGLLHFRSDVEEYGGLVRYLVEKNGAFAPHDAALAETMGVYAPTHREQWCARHGKAVWAYYFARKETA